MCVGTELQTGSRSATTYIWNMWELLLAVLTSLSLVSALPCCPNNNEITHVNNSIVCYPDTHMIVTVFKWCDNFYMIEKDHPELDDAEFLENENKTKFFDGFEWSSEYCTTTLRADSPLPKDHYLSNKTGKVLALLCFPDDEEEVDDHFFLYGICLLISCVFLLATLIVYLLLPDLRDLQGKCVFCLVLSLMLGYLGLSYLQLPFTAPDFSHPNCVNAAFFTYFWMLSAFFWLNISSFNMWRNSVLAHVDISESKLMTVYYLAGFGFPCLFLLFALFTHHLPGEHIRPRFGESSCWFRGKFEQWVFFYGIVLVLLILNIVYFISTAVYLWSDYRSPNPRPRIKTMRTKFCVYFKLFMVMGITWIFEILSAIANEPWFVTDILNCLQGIVIFLVMVVFRKRVWRGLAAKKFFGEGRRFAHCWERMEDEESDNEPIENAQMSS